ncbi:MAG: transcriptional repressor [Candidatus Omnitrophica bacterium]|nr:transcriptional repressor [Candidatus Omnitrophota bacterium]MCM8793229.1 transcriptional repressor [Candidatus Omnitrophota bacterium]
MEKKIQRRLTKQRRIILEELRKTKSHPTADTLFKLVRRRLPRIGFGTVYRNLNLLREEGEILELTCGKYSCRYDGNMEPHYHFFCLRCKRVLDLGIPILKGLDAQVGEKIKGEVKYHRIDFYGYCRECSGR